MELDAEDPALINITILIELIAQYRELWEILARNIAHDQQRTEIETLEKINNAKLIQNTFGS